MCTVHCFCLFGVKMNKWHDKMQDMNVYLSKFVWHKLLGALEYWSIWNDDSRTLHLSTLHEVHKTDVPPPRAKMPFLVSGSVEADQ